jgi:alkylhydroperoxidase family enzyme
MNTQARIQPVEEPLTPDLAQRMRRLVPEGMKPPQLFLTVARNAGLFAHLVDGHMIGPTGLLDRRVLARTLRECVILRTCVAAQNDYEFNLHVQTISRRMGLTSEQIDDVRAPHPKAGLWPADHFIAMSLVDGLVTRLEVSDATYTQARQHFDEATLIEITQLVGLYVGVAMQVALARPQFDEYRPGPPELSRHPGGPGPA